MPVYVSTSCLAGAGTVFDVLEVYAQAGLQNVELGSVHRYSGEISPARLKSYGFNLLCHHYFPPPEKPVVVNLASVDPVILRDSKEHLKRSIDFCCRMEIGLFTFHAGFRADPHANPDGRFGFPRDKVVPYETAFDIFVDAIEEVDAYALERGVRIGIENNVLSDYNVVDGRNPFLLLCEAGEFERLWARITSPNVGVLLDLGHLKPASHWLHFDRYQFVDAVKGRVFALHIHENNGRLDEHLALDNKSWCLEIIQKDCFRDIPVVIESFRLTAGQIMQQVKLIEGNLGRKD